MPFDESFKRDLLAKYDTLAPDQRLGIERLLWDLYDAMYTLRLQEKIDLAMNPYAEKKVTLDEDFYERIEDEVEKEMTEQSLKTIEAVDLQSTRDQLQSILDKPQN